MHEIHKMAYVVRIWPPYVKCDICAQNTHEHIILWWLEIKLK